MYFIVKGTIAMTTADMNRFFLHISEKEELSAFAVDVSFACQQISCPGSPLKCSANGLKHL